MYHFITVHNLLHLFLSLLVIHTVNLSYSPIISLLKTFKFRLQFLEIISESLVFFGQVDVVGLMGGLFFLETFFYGADERHGLAFLST